MSYDYNKEQEYVTKLKKEEFRRELEVYEATIMADPTLMYDDDRCYLYISTYFTTEKDTTCELRCYPTEENIQKYFGKLFEFTHATRLEGQKIRIVGRYSMVGFGHPTLDRFIVTGIPNPPSEEMTYEQLVECVTNYELEKWRRGIR